MSFAPAVEEIYRRLEGQTYGMFPASLPCWKAPVARATSARLDYRQQAVQPDPADIACFGEKDFSTGADPQMVADMKAATLETSACRLVRARRSGASAHVTVIFRLAEQQMRRSTQRDE